MYWKYQSYFNQLINYYKNNSGKYCESVMIALENLVKFIMNKEEKNKNTEKQIVGEIKKGIKSVVIQGKLPNNRTQKQKKNNEKKLNEMYTRLTLMKLPSPPTG